MLVSYSDGQETLVVDEKDEAKLLKVWFGEKMGRDVEDYNRAVSELVHITSTLDCRAETVD